ncbi:MAG: type I-C CRISPR-associated protein Cas7/Csd2 [Oscillospiraceae bacterium]
MIVDTRIDFMGLIGVSLANPNGDPVNGGAPRTLSDGCGIITDVCIKRKLRNRLAELGESILVQPQRDITDSIESRLRCLSQADDESIISEACKRWYDVRAFGQLLYGVGRKRAKCLSVCGAVTVQHALSLHPVELLELPITRCINGRSSAGRASDTMGMRTAVRYGLYRLKGSVCAGAAAKTGFSQEDADKLKSALLTLFANDACAARPEGSMVMERLYWWKHSAFSGNVSAAKVFDTVKLTLREGCATPLSFEDYIVEEQHLNGITPEIFC